MKTTIAYFTMIIIVMLLTLSLSGISYSAIDSVAEINVKDDKIIIADSQAELILVVKIEKIDISQDKKKEEEIDAIQITFPKGIALKAVKSVIIDGIMPIQEKIPYNNTMMFIKLPEPITKPGKVTVELTVEKFTVGVSPELEKQLEFVISLYNNKKSYLVPSVKSGNADGINNNNSLTLKPETEQSLLFNKRLLIFIGIFITIIAVLILTAFLFKKSKRAILDKHKEANFNNLPLKGKLEYITEEIKYLRQITIKSLSNLNKWRFPIFKVKVSVSEVSAIRLAFYDLHTLTPNILSESFKDIQWTDLFNIGNKMNFAITDLNSSRNDVEKIKMKLESLTNDASLMEDLQAIDTLLKEELEFIQSVRKILDNEKETKENEKKTRNQQITSQENKQPTVTSQEIDKQTATPKKTITLEDLGARVENLELMVEIIEGWTRDHNKEHKKGGSGKGFSVNQQSNTPLDIFVRSYNEAVDNQKKLGDFNKKYQSTRVGAANAMDRRQNPSLEPVFQTSSSGAYLAVKIEGLSRYAVVPRPGTAINDYIYLPGAAGLIFDCPGYSQGNSYEKAKVINPALFDTDNSREIWTFKEKGELDLK